MPLLLRDTTSYMQPLERIEQHLVTCTLSLEGQRQYALGDVGARELAPFVEEIRDISARYIEHTVGTALTSPIMTLRGAQAYSLYYAPINAAKVIHLLPQLSFNTEEVRVLDVGCGPGTVGLALLAASHHSLHLTCVESSSEMRATATKLLQAWAPPSTLRALSIIDSLSSLDPRASFDLIVAANVLAELPESEAQRHLATLSTLMRPGGYLLLIEPGQRAHTRRLMQLRDQLVRTQPQLTPLFPCLRGDLCPMLKASENDWCHGELEWSQPRLHRQLDKLLQFNKHRIKFSSFLFQNGGQLRSGMRVLTPPRKTSRGVEALICGAKTYGLVWISKKHRSSATRAFEKSGVFNRLSFTHQFTGEAPSDLQVSIPDDAV